MGSSYICYLIARKINNCTMIGSCYISQTSCQLTYIEMSSYTCNNCNLGFYFIANLNV